MFPISTLVILSHRWCVWCVLGNLSTAYLSHQSTTVLSIGCQRTCALTSSIINVIKYCNIALYCWCCKWYCMRVLYCIHRKMHSALGIYYKDYDANTIHIRYLVVNPSSNTSAGNVQYCQVYYCCLQYKVTNLVTFLCFMTGTFSTLAKCTGGHHILLRHGYDSFGRACLRN